MVSIPTQCVAANMEDIWKPFLFFFYFQQKPTYKFYLEQNVTLASDSRATAAALELTLQRSAQAASPGLCQHQVFQGKN